MAQAHVRRGGRHERSLVALVKIRPFRRMWASIGISSFGDWIGLLAMMTLAQQLTKASSGATQAAAVSGVLIVRLAPDLIFAPIAGAIADRFDRRRTVIIGEITAALLYVAIAVTYDIRTMYVGQFLIEAIGLITMASKQTLWMSTVPKEKIPIGNQLLMFTIYGSFPIAAVVFTTLATLHSFFIPPSEIPAMAEQKFVVLAALFLDAATYFVSAAIIFLSRSDLPARVAGRDQQPDSIVKVIGEGIKFVFSNRVVRALYVGVIGAFAAAGITAGIALTYVNSLDAGFAGYGILLGTAFTGLAIGMLIGPRVLPSLSRKRIFGLSIAIAGAFLIGMGLARDFILGVVLSFGVGFFAGMAWILGYTMIGQEVAEHIRGRTFSFVVSSARIMLMLTLGLGPALSAFLGGHEFTMGGVTFIFTGPGLTLVLAGVVAMLIGLYAGRSVGPMRALGLRWFIDRISGEDVFAMNNAGGLFIVLESADRRLAAEQAKALSARLSADGYPVVLTGEPTDSGVGARISELLDHIARGDGETGGVLPSTAVFLAAADRAEHVDKLIRPALDDGKIVVSSGYVDTTLAFFSHASEVDTEEIVRLSDWGNEGLYPDLTLILDVDVAEDEPLGQVRQSLLDRREAMVRGYRVVPASPHDEGLMPDVWAPVCAALTARRELVANGGTERDSATATPLIPPSQ